MSPTPTTLESCESAATVVLDRPANARPTTGITGAPQPMTLHGPVESPTTLTAAPATVPGRERTAAVTPRVVSATARPTRPGIPPAMMRATPALGKPGPVDLDFGHTAR